jgi:hypothetical protein
MGYAKTYEDFSLGISDTILASADSEEAVPDAAYTSKKDFTLVQNVDSVCFLRFYCELKNTTGTVNYIIYLNGSTASVGGGGGPLAVYTGYSGDKEFSNLKKGDVLAFMAKSNDGNGFIKNCRILGTQTPFRANQL